MRLLIANGPNLNLLGAGEPAIYGTETLADVEAACRRRAEAAGAELDFFQTNHEGEMLDRLQRDAPEADGLILNPGAFSHQSYALYDCLKALSVPVVEVHITNIHARPETWRQHSLTAPAAVGVIMGLGTRGYVLAMEWFFDRDQ